MIEPFAAVVVGPDQYPVTLQSVVLRARGYQVAHIVAAPVIASDDVVNLCCFIAAVRTDVPIPLQYSETDSGPVARQCPSCS